MLPKSYTSTATKALTISCSSQTRPRNASIKDVECIGSYNQIPSARCPTIMVPGSPRVWREPVPPFSIQSDTCLRRTERRMPPLIRSMPFHTLMCAIDAKKLDSIPWPSVDFITDCGTLRRLLEFVNASTDGKELRLDLQVVGQHTILLNNSHPQTDPVIKRDKAVKQNKESFGHSFEMATTAVPPGGETTSGYYRILQYVFGHLHMIVRAEVDACLSVRKHTLPSEPTTSKDIAGLHVIAGGTHVPQDSILELKSRGGKNRNHSDIKSRVFPQLFFSRTPNLIEGAHTDGTVSNIRHHGFSGEMEPPPGSRTHDRLCVLVAALKLIQEIAISRSRSVRPGQFVVVFHGKQITVHDLQGTDRLLPHAIVKKFWPRGPT